MAHWMIPLPMRAARFVLSFGLLSCISVQVCGQQAPALISTGTRSGLRLFYPNSNDWWLDPSAGRLDIKLNGAAAPAASLNSLGNLGIGTASPGVNSGSGRTLTLATPEANSLNNAASLELVGAPNGANDIGSRIDFITKGIGVYTTTARIGSAPFTWDSAQLMFYTTPGGGSLMERMRIDINGKVGIGTTNPARTVHLSGLSDVGMRIQSTDSVGGASRIELGSRASQSCGDLVWYEPSQTLALWSTCSGAGTGSIELNAGSTGGHISLMSGKVGIGTTDPQEALQVNGRIMAADPGTNPNAVATKQYVDAAAAGGVKTWFRPAGYFQGNAAGLSYPSTGVCGAGYHMCYINEWVGRKWDQSKESPPYLLYENAWVATYSYHMGNNYWHSLPSGANPDCANWSGLSDGGGSFYGTYVNMGGAPPTFGTTVCAASYKVMCCQD